MVGDEIQSRRLYAADDAALITQEPKVTTEQTHHREESGSYAGMTLPDASAVREPAHQHRTSATPDNGTHTASGNVCSNAVSNKQLSNSELREVIREAMYGARS